MRNTKIVLLVIILGFALIILSTKVPIALRSGKTVGNGSSSFSKTTEEISQALASNKPVVLCFHSTTCAPCVEMEAILKEIESEFREEIVFVSVVTDNPREQQLVEQYRIEFIPTTFIYDKKGKVVQKYVGVVEKGVLVDLLRGLVGS